MRFHLGFVLGTAAGFYAGAKVGQQALDRISVVVSKQKLDSSWRSADSAPSSGPTGSSDSVTGPASADMNPSDLQFGHAAAKKEALVDEALAEGIVGQLVDEGAEPRAGNKAQPT